MTILQCYAPTNDSSEEKKDAFYELLQQEIDKTQKHDIKIIMGDMNAKVGSSNIHYERAMGKHGCGNMNENGERLAELYTTNNYVIGGTIFPHRNIHKLTWCSPNQRDKNQIDHIMINGVWKRSLLDVKVKRGADVGRDHHLVKADIKLKLRANGKNTRSWKQFDIEKLKESNVRKEYTTLIRNRFRILENLNDEDDTVTIDDKWGKISEIFTKSAEESIGFKQKQKYKDWITPRTWDNIIIRRDTKKKLNEAKSQRLKERYQLEYSQIHRNVNRMVRNDKRAHMNSLAEKAEEAANKGEQVNLHKITKIICGKNTASSNIPVKDKLGNLLTSKK
ncbi:craniofacial development protein 2-like [Mytilus trossulus]|uniref:craniofacial development protein 2-like n=1 Tax=Mytilus trossulus TaxID=6551 RepID=UPI0030063939